MSAVGGVGDRSEVALVGKALESAWAQHELGTVSPVSLPSPIEAAIADILKKESPPNRSYLLAIASGTAAHPATNPSALQLEAGVDRRSQAKRLGRVLGSFQEARGLRLKISQDPGVSNQWREPEINTHWVAGRKSHDFYWAEGFRVVTEWLGAVVGQERAERAQELLAFAAVRFVEEATASTFNYPQFPASPHVAMCLVREFMELAPNRPDAAEAVVTAAVRVVTAIMPGQLTVDRGDTNSPDAIDVLITSEDGRAVGGVEVTDTPITMTKLQREVLPAMQKHGLKRGLVVSLGVGADDVAEIHSWIAKVFATVSQRIDLATIDNIETWLAFPGAPEDLSSDFLVAVGTELDRFSETSNRQAWFRTLTAFTSRVNA